MTYFEKKQSWKKMVAGISAALVLAGAAGVSACSYQQQLEENKELRQHINSIQTEVDSRDEQIEGQQKELDALEDENVHLKNKVRHLEKELSSSLDVVVTAYDLSVASCGKPVGSHGYGITASGINLAGHTLESARAIAVDPNVIPIGSKVRIKFDNPSMKKYDGIYTAVDTGGAIQGNRIDLFFGDHGSNEPSSRALAFGVQEAKATLA